MDETELAVGQEFDCDGYKVKIAAMENGTVKYDISRDGLFVRRDERYLHAFKEAMEVFGY